MTSAAVDFQGIEVDQANIRAVISLKHSPPLLNDEAQEQYRNSIRNLSRDEESDELPSRDAIETAVALVDYIQEDLPPTYIYVGPNGGIELDWDLDSGATFTLIASGDGSLAVSGLNTETGDRLRAIEKDSLGEPSLIARSAFAWLSRMAAR